MITYTTNQDGTLRGNGQLSIYEGHYLYDLVLKQVEEGEAEIIPYSEPVEPIDELADRKRDALRDGCRNAITTIFQSSALGSQHSYDCRPEDQSNIRTRLEASRIDGQTRKVWAHDGEEFTRTPHTTVQLEAVVIDMEAHIETQQARLESLINSVNAIETGASTDSEKRDQIEAIEW